MSTDYSKMSDFEVNKSVASLIYSKSQTTTPYNHRPDVQVFHLNGTNELFDYCNNPADAWPIIVGNKISIVSLDNKWIAAPVDTVIDGITGDSEVCFYASYDAVSDVNPLRAAMIVFLMIQESKNAS